MKKFFTLAIVLLAAVTVSAQKGTFYLGTSGMNPFAYAVENSAEATKPFTFSPMTGFSSLETEEGTKLTNWGLAPEIGYFVTDKLAVGLGLFYTSSCYDLNEEGIDKLTLNTFGVNPYVRYHFIAKGAFKMYGQADFIYASAKQDADGAESTDFFSVGVKPGVSYNLSDCFAINATFGNLGYEDMKDTYSRFGLNLDMSSLKFGFTVSF